MPHKRLFILTFGCQMNVYDSERIAHLLATRDYHLVDKPDDADLIFINTCSVREKPVEKFYSALGRFRRLKRNRPQLIIGVGGCAAQQEGKKILSRSPYVDFIIGTKEFPNILDILDEAKGNSDPIIATNLNGRVDPYASLPLPTACSKATTFVSIMQGCDNFCSYCIVPYVRGREVSRPLDKILEEIQGLADQGVREVTLLGQNVNSYGQKTTEGKNFVDLLKGVNEISGIERIRFTTSHPKDLSVALIESFGSLPKLCEHIHLPLQSGSDRILRKMTRGYSKDEYLAKIAALRQACPEISITTDIIVGFPGESEEDFEKTLEMIEKVQFDDLFSFKYSDRPGTQAVFLEGKVPLEVGRRRLAELQARQRKISEKRNHSFEGREMEILVEGSSKHNPAENAGRTRTNRIVNFSGTRFPEGSLVRIKLKKAMAHSFRGELADSSMPVGRGNLQFPLRDGPLPRKEP